MIWGLLRIKNEARWIDRVVKSIRPACERILVLDDHSTDGTPEICESLGCEVTRSTFDGIHESRDKDFLLEKLWEAGAQVGDWCLMVDGDEMLHPSDVPVVQRACAANSVAAYALPILYLWDTETQIRVDGVYRDFRRPSMFRLTERELTFKRTEFGGNFHCSSVPATHIGCALANILPARLLHLGYLYKSDRIRKYEWYNSVDPNNSVEDGYRHMVCGDIFPANSRFRWGGPLRLEELCMGA